MQKIKAHPYFAEMAWPALEEGIAKSPYIVKAKGPGDVRSFDSYDEEKIEWRGDGSDGYKDMFIAFG